MSFSIEHIYSLLTAVSSAVILTLGFLLAKIRLDRFQELRKVRLYLSLSYFILGISGLLIFMMQGEGLDSSLLLLITVGVSSFQSMLFMLAHFVLLRSAPVKREVLLRHLFGIALVVALLLISHFNGLVADSVLIAAAIILYLAQQINYVARFDRQYQEVTHTFSLTEKGAIQLKTVRYSFYGALSIGLFSLLAAVGGLILYALFIILYTAFYTHMVILIYNNRFVTENSCLLPEKKIVCQELEESSPETGEVKLKLEKWVAEKGYLQNDLSVDEMAALLGTDRRTLRNYFRTQIKTDFRTWRAQLRIEEAKELLLSHPESSVSQIGEMVGYNHRSNFFTQFSKITGENPSRWREEHLQH